MSTTMDTTTLVMTSEYAAAIRLQLEPLARVLEPFDEAAARAGDMLVLRLIARIAEAVQAAEEIEQTRRPAPAYRGGEAGQELTPVNPKTEERRRSHPMAEDTAPDLLPVPDNLPTWVRVLASDELYQRMMSHPEETIPFQVDEARAARLT